MRRWLAAFVTAVLLHTVVVPSADAGAEWCEHDPLVPIVTPGGAQVDIHVTNYGRGAEHAEAVRAARISYAARPADNGRATNVTISVLVPGNTNGKRFATRSVASTGPGATGTVLRDVGGASGNVMTLAFKLAVP
jgi:hypothetical protein